MTLEQKISVLASAILELSENAAVEWEYSSEQTVSTGVNLSMESDLRKLIINTEEQEDVDALWKRKEDFISRIKDPWTKQKMIEMFGVNTKERS